MSDHQDATPINTTFVWEGKAEPIDERFTYEGNQLLFNGIPRYSSSKLYKLFFIPGDIPEEHRDRWTADAYLALTPEVLEAQLRHYDISFPLDSMYNQRVEILCAAVVNKMCREVPVKIRMIEAVIRLRQISNTTLRGLPIKLRMDCPSRSEWSAEHHSEQDGIF